jgi:hypothetical protein
MLNLPIDKLKILCLTNKYAHQLCQDKFFWLDKFKFDEFIIPDEVRQLQDVNWFKIYRILNFISNI